MGVGEGSVGRVGWFCESARSRSVGYDGGEASGGCKWDGKEDVEQGRGSAVEEVGFCCVIRD